VEDVVTVPSQVRVVCKHGVVATFVASSVPGVWIISTQHAGTQHADWVTYPEGVERLHAPVECRKCGVTAPAVKRDIYGSALEWIVERDRPGITWVSPTVVEVPLVVWARKLGGPHEPG
jgi:hypothetical protein